MPLVYLKKSGLWFDNGMGLFSSDKKYLAFAATGDLIPPEDRADTLTNSIIQASKANESIASAVLYAIGTNLGARAAAMIKYAAKYDDPLKTGGYIRGLPTSDQPNFSIADGVLLSALERAVGEPIEEAPWMFIGGPNEDFLLDKHIQSAYLDPVYFPWGVAPSEPVWDEKLEFIEIPVIDPTTGSYYVTDNEPIYIRTEYQGTLTYENLQDLPADIYALLGYGDVYSSEYSFGFAYTANTGEVETWESPAKLDLTEYEGKDLIQVRYSTVANPLVTQYWIYIVGSNVDPELESRIETNNILNNFMPVVIMMQDRVWFNEEEDSELHITTNKILKKLAIKGDEIREEFEEQEQADLESGEAKKKDPEKWDFFIHFAAPVMSKTRGTLEYLYHFFLEMEKNQQHTYEDYQRYLQSAKVNKNNGYNLPQPISEIKITEGGVNGYNVRLGWSYIYSETFPGKFIGDDNKDLRINHFDSDLYQRLKYNDTKYRVGIDEMHESGSLIGRWNNYSDPDAKKSHKNGYHDYVIYTQQHYDRDADTWSHTRVLCMGLSMEYTINTRDTAEGKKGYRFRYAEPHIFDLNEETGEYLNGFRIPIHIGILKNSLRKMHHEELMQDSMSATVFLVKEISIPWYQTGFWKWLIVIIAIILIVLSIIYAGGAGTETLIGVIVGALGATGLMAFILYVVLLFAFGFIIGLASATISEEFGTTAGIIFALFAAFAMGGGFNNFSLANAFPGFSTWGSAQVTLTSTLAVVNTGLQIYSTHELAKLQADLRDFMLTQREKADELREAWDQLGPPREGFDTLGYMAATDRGATGESPGSYLARTLNANPGLLGYDFVYQFVPMCLTLPEQPGQVGTLEAQYLSFQRQIGAV